MEYEKKYKEALKWVQKLYPSFEGWVKEDAEHYFPELKESKDDKIRKAIHIYLDWLDGRKDYAPKGDYTIRDMIAWVEKQGEPEDKGEISDGYHTFNELYNYRMLYNAAFFNLLPKQLVHKSKMHHDGKECFGGGWFIVMANLPTGQISNHYELKDWDLFQIPEKEIADEWDGHTPQEAAERLHKYLLEKQVKESAIFQHEDKTCKENSNSLTRKLDTNKVIEWLERNSSMFWDSPCNPSRIVELFKKDFEI